MILLVQMTNKVQLSGLVYWGPVHKACLAVQNLRFYTFTNHQFFGKAKCFFRECLHITDMFT